jgi:4-alpha-glucanotransferase
LIRIAMASVADTVIVPLQDVLGLDSVGRMNVPGQAAGNWAWRFQSGQLDPRLRARLAGMTAVYSRWNGEPPMELGPPRHEVVKEPTVGR